MLFRVSPSSTERRVRAEYPDDTPLNMNVLIREARASDRAAIRKVQEDTFAGVDELVPDLTMALRDDETARPMLVLVAGQR